MSAAQTALIRNDYQITEREWRAFARVNRVQLPSLDVSSDTSRRRGSGVPYLTLIRESGPRRRKDLESLHERTLLHLAGQPGIEELRAEGIRPILEPEKFPGALFRRLPDGGSACLRASGDVWELLLLGSAAVENIDVNGQVVSRLEDATHNAATMLVQSVLERLRPRICRIGGFDRLVRAFEASPGMFKTFKSNVGWLEFGHTALSLADPTAKQQWQNYTLQSTAAHLATVDKTTDGRLSAVRMGRWPFAPLAVPNGLERTRDKRLVVSKADRAGVRLLVEGLSRDLTITQLAQSLVDNGATLTRRSPVAADRVVEGEVTAVAPGAEFRRVMGRVRGFAHALPDMAMGKFVLSLLQARSLDHTYLGFRPVWDGGETRHQLVWDVPDIFVDDDGLPLVAEETLLAAVRVATRRRVEASLPASPWLDELAGREWTRSRIAEGPRSAGQDPELEDIARWARYDGSMIDVVAPAVHPRFEKVEREIRRAQSTAVPRPQHPNQNLNGWMVGLPAWVADDGRETWLGSAGNSNNYTLYGRLPDPGLPASASLRRSRHDTEWATGSREPIGKVNRVALHESVATSIVTALDSGTGLISRSEAWVATGEVACAEHGGDGTRGVCGCDDDDRSVELSSLRAELANAETEAGVLVRGLLTLAALDVGDSDASRARHAALMRASNLEVDQAQDRVKQLEEEIDSLEASVPTPSADAATPAEPPITEIPLSDVDLLVDVLVALRTDGLATSREVRLWHQLVPHFRAHVADGLLHWEARVLLRLADGDERVVGPIRGHVTVDERKEKIKRWPETVTHHLCVKSLDTAELHDGVGMRSRVSARIRNSPEQRLMALAADFLAPIVGRRAAVAAVTCPMLEIRTLIWDLAQSKLGSSVRESKLPDATEAFLGHFADVYDNNPEFRSRRYADFVFPRQRLVDAVIAAGGSMGARELGVSFFPDAAPNRVARGVTAQIDKSALHGRTPILRSIRADPSHKAGGPIESFRTQLCPHCESEGLSSHCDLVLPVPEVTAGLLCSTCLRMPVPESPVFPAIYRELPELLTVPVQRLREPHRGRGSA